MFNAHLPLLTLIFVPTIVSITVQAFQQHQQLLSATVSSNNILAFAGKRSHFLPENYIAIVRRNQQYKYQQTFLPKMTSKSAASSGASNENLPHCKHVLFVECGFGNDSHGQNPTKAAVRACRNAIEFNSIPSINNLVPGGYEKLKLDVILAIPPKYQQGLDLEAVKSVFPYGETKFTIQDGGMIAPSGIAIDSLGDKNDDMIIVCCAVTVGY